MRYVRQGRQVGKLISEYFETSEISETRETSGQVGKLISEYLESKF